MKKSKKVATAFEVFYFCLFFAALAGVLAWHGGELQGKRSSYAWWSSFYDEGVERAENESVAWQRNFFSCEKAYKSSVEDAKQKLIQEVERAGKVCLVWSVPRIEDCKLLENGLAMCAQQCLKEIRVREVPLMNVSARDFEIRQTHANTSWIPMQAEVA